MIPEGYRIERGLLWPAEDRGAADVLFAQVSGLACVYPHVREFKVAVQAGGNCGLWPRELGQKFETVYTFEPDPVNFRCLCANAPAENIYKFNAALGTVRQSVGLQRRPDNVGAHRISGRGAIPTLRLDDLTLAACDLVYLDVEGYELFALQGGRAVIGDFRPTIVIEDKGVSEHYGVAKGEATAWLAKHFGYRVAETIDKDVVLTT